jgi:hypothetical protein
MTELTQAGYDFLWKLSSLDEALKISSVDPIVVPSSLSLKEPKRVTAFSHMYYDSHENEEGALAIIRQRRKIAYKDIEAHLLLHERMRDNLDLINLSIPENDDEVIYSNSRKLVDNIEELGVLIENHH